MQNSKQKWTAWLTLIMDIGAITAAVFLTFHFRFSLGMIPAHKGIPNFFQYQRALIVIIPVYLWFLRAYGLYSTQSYRRRVEEIFCVIRAVTFSILILMALTFFYRYFSYSRVYLVTLWLASILTISFGRYCVIQFQYRQRLQHKDWTKVLILGANRNTRHIIQWMRQNRHFGKEVIGVLTQDSTLSGKHFEDVPVLGTLWEAETHIQKTNPHEVILVDTRMPQSFITQLVAFCEDQFINFKMAADIYGLMTKNLTVEYISSVPLLGFHDLPLDDPWNRAIKRTFDILVSLLMLFFTFPVWIITMALIKLQDRGPIFYQQERMGRDQKIFGVLKFRTMRTDAEKETGPVWAKADDSRRTGLGTFLRKWNIDELPQLFNVLKGDMSLVGPRPERPHFIEKFREHIPRYMTRHKVKAGLTGWAQVHGFRGNTSIEERIKYDLYYMENWSIVLDIEILFMTLFAFKNAY